MQTREDIGPARRSQGYGVFAEISPRLLSIGAVWVLAADGVFTGMALRGGHVEAILCAVGAVLLVGLLVLTSASHVLVIIASLASAGIFGDVMLHITGLLGFSLLIAFEIGVMHYCALRILARMRQDLHARFVQHRASTSES
jgi:hypothetical protein